MFGLLSKLRFRMKDTNGRLFLRSAIQHYQNGLIVVETVWVLKYRNLASALFALPLRASSQVRSSNAGTAFSKPGGGPLTESRLLYK